MSRVALVTAPRNDQWPDHEVPLIIDAFEQKGISAEATPWYEPREWSAYDLIVLRSGSWDTLINDGGVRRAQYFAWMNDLESSGAIIINPPSLVQWVTDKMYMNELSEKGVPIVPTTFVGVNESPFFSGCEICRQTLKRFGSNRCRSI